MNGKKFVFYFVMTIAVTGVGIGYWIKRGYDSRPDVKIEAEKK